MLPLVTLARVDELEGQVVVAEELLEDSLLRVWELGARGVPLRHPVAKERA